MYKNVASQKLIVFAFDSTTNLPKTGDAANLTAYVSKDYGAVTVLGDTSATEMDATNAKGYYLFDLTQGETNADTLCFTAKSSTANIVVIGVPATVFTEPPNFHAMSIDSNGRVDVIKLAGTTCTARDIGASVLLSSGAGTGQLDFTSGVVKANVTQLLGTAWLAPGTAGTPDVNVKLWNALTTVALPLVPTTAGRTLDVSAGGEAGVDWANIGSPTTSVNLSGTTIATTQKVDVETIKTNPVVNAGTITFPSGATLASTTNITAGTMTTTTNLTNLPAITANWLTAAGIASGAITSAKFAAGAIDATAIADGAIDRSTFAADTGLQSARSNTAQAGASTTITLDASASATTDFYTGAWVYLTGGTGVGQWRLVTAYNGSTKVATVAPAWATNPDNTSTFAIMPAAKISGVTLADTTTTLTNAPSDSSGVTTLLTRLSATRAGYLDNLSGGAVALAATALSTAQWTNGRASNLDNLDMTISSRGTSTLTQTQVTGGSYALNSASFAFNSGLDFTTTQKAATLARVTLTDTLTTYTGNTPQSGDAYAQTNSGTFGLAAIKGYVDDIGVAGAGLTALGDTRLAHLDADITSRATTAAVAAQITTDHGSGSYQTATGFSTLDAAGVRTAVGLASANLDTQLSGINSKTTNLPSDPADASDIAAAFTSLQTHGDSTWSTATGFAVAGDAMTLTVGERNSVADAVLTRDVSNVEGTANDHSLCYVVLASSEWSVSGTALTVKKTDGTTTFATKTLTKTTGDDPVRGAT